jgi:glycosyltransferase involved in cell wall biosynthesis
MVSRKRALAFATHQPQAEEDAYMGDIKAEERPRALFVTPDLPYPLTHGRPLRQSLQIEALAMDYEVTVVVEREAPKIRSVEIAEDVKVSVDTLGRRSTLAGNLDARELKLNELISAPPARNRYKLDELFKTLHLIEGFTHFLTDPWSIFDPAPARLHKKSRSEYLSYFESKRFDLIWVSRLEAAWTIGPPGPAPCVLDMDDLESGVYKSKAELQKGMSGGDFLYMSQRAMEIARIEREIGLSYTLVALSAAKEVERIGLPNARLLQNCAPPNVVERRCPPTDSERILFIGLIEYPPNLHGICWFLESVWPAVRGSRSNASIDIVGECFNADQHANLVLPPNVRLHGFVENAAPLWEQAAILVAPLFAGGGTRIKILEAWSRGVPVVTTSVGIAGLEAIDGVHALIADTAEAFAEQCVRLLSSPALQNVLANEGKELVRSKYSRDHAIASIREVTRQAQALKSEPAGPNLRSN